MKKLPLLLFVACFLLIIHSCNVDEVNEPFELADLSVRVPGYISEDDALELANQFASSYDAFAEGSRSTNRMASSRTNIVSSGSYSRADSDPFYVINYDNGQGFIILSRKEIECPILAFIPEGTYSASEYAGHDGLNFFLECANDYVNDCEPASISSVKPGSPNNPIQIIQKESVLPIIPVRWGQESVFGAFCPNKISGCMATALAQIFTVIRPFNNLKLTYMGLPPKLCPDIDLEWDSIIRYNRTKYSYITLTQKNDTALIRESTSNEGSDAADRYIISALMREIGHRIKADYSKDSSTSATLDNTLHALRYEFNLINASDTFPVLEHLNRLPNIFNNGSVVLMLGYPINKKWI